MGAVAEKAACGRLSGRDGGVFVVGNDAVGELVVVLVDSFTIGANAAGFGGGAEAYMGVFCGGA